MALYRNQKRKDQGLPSRAKRISGSKLSLPFVNFKSNKSAGSLKEKEGTKEIPLWVTLAVPLKSSKNRFSVSCANELKATIVHSRTKLMSLGGQGNLLIKQIGATSKTLLDQKAK